MNLNEISMLKKWSKIYLLPKLKEVVNKILNDKELKLSYSRIETTFNDSCYNWLISTITNEVLERKDGVDINEVVISISCQALGDVSKFSFDISFGDGDIYFELPSLEVKLSNEITIAQINDLLNADINKFLYSSYELTRLGILYISKK